MTSHTVLVVYAVTVLRSTGPVFTFFLTFIYLCAHAHSCVCVCVIAHVWRSEDSLLVFSLYHARIKPRSSELAESLYPLRRLIKRHAQVFYGLLPGLDCYDGFLVVSGAGSSWEENQGEAPFLPYCRRWHASDLICDSSNFWGFSTVRLLIFLSPLLGFFERQSQRAACTPVRNYTLLLRSAVSV